MEIGKISGLMLARQSTRPTMPKQYHRAEYSQRGIRFQALAASQLRYVAAMLAVLGMLEGQMKSAPE